MHELFRKANIEVVGNTHCISQATPKEPCEGKHWCIDIADIVMTPRSEDVSPSSPRLVEMHYFLTEY